MLFSIPTSLAILKCAYHKFCFLLMTIVFSFQWMGSISEDHKCWPVFSVQQNTFSDCQTQVFIELTEHYVGLDSWHICIVYIMTYFLGHELVHNSKLCLVSWWCAQLQIFSVLSFNSQSSQQFSKMSHFFIGFIHRQSMKYEINM